MRVAHLVDKLLGNGRNGHSSAGVRMLCHYECAIGPHFHEWITHVRQIRDGAPIIEAVTARALRSTLDDVARNDSGRKLIPAGRAPAELVAKGSHSERRIRRAPGDDDVRAFFQRLDDWFGAYIRVGGKNAVPHAS